MKKDSQVKIPSYRLQNSNINDTNIRAAQSKSWDVRLRQWGEPPSWIHSWCVPDPRPPASPEVLGCSFRCLVLVIDVNGFLSNEPQPSQRFVSLTSTVLGSIKALQPGQSIRLSGTLDALSEDKDRIKTWAHMTAEVVHDWHCFQDACGLRGCKRKVEGWKTKKANRPN